MINVIDIIIYSLYVIVFTFIIFCISKNKMYSTANLLILICFFIFINYINILNEVVRIIPNFLDSEYYKLYITHDYVKEEFYNFALGYKTAYYISFVAKYFFLQNSFLYLIFQKFILILAILILWKAIKNIVNFTYNFTPNQLEKLQRVYLIIIIMYPALTLYTSALLRDYLTILSSSVWILGLSYLAIGNKKSGIKYIIVTLIAFYFIRYQFVLIIFISLLLILFLKIKSKKIKYYLVPFLSIFGGFIGYYFLTIIGYVNFLTPDGFSYLRAYRITQFSESNEIYGNIDFSSYLDILAYMPLYILQFIFSPMPILSSINPLSYILGSLDAFYIMFIFLLLFISRKKLKGNKVILIFLILFIFTIIPSALFEFHISGAIRHRIPYVLLLIVPTTILLWEKYYNIRRKNA